LIEWEDFNAFGQTIDAVVQALIGLLYLPPDGFEHPRYGGGSGCWFPATLKYGPSGWMAEITCPFGYFEKKPPYDTEDLETQIDGVVGHCALDGYGGGPTGDAAGPVVAASPTEPGVFERLYYVTDLEAFVAAIEASWSAGSITAELAAMFTTPNGVSELHEGDEFTGYSTPSVDGIGPGEAFRRTVGYWADQVGPVPLWKLLPDVELPPDLAERPAHELRAFNTWRFRVRRADGMTVSFYIRTPRPELAEQ
jgi:hypothetical protein